MREVMRRGNKRGVKDVSCVECDSSKRAFPRFLNSCPKNPESRKIGRQRASSETFAKTIRSERQRKGYENSARCNDREGRDDDDVQRDAIASLDRPIKRMQQWRVLHQTSDWRVLLTRLLRNCTNASVYRPLIARKEANFSNGCTDKFR